MCPHQKNAERKARRREPPTAPTFGTFCNKISHQTPTVVVPMRLFTRRNRGVRLVSTMHKKPCRARASVNWRRHGGGSGVAASRSPASKAAGLRRGGAGGAVIQSTHTHATGQRNIRSTSRLQRGSQLSEEPRVCYDERLAAPRMPTDIVSLCALPAQRGPRKGDA